MQKRSSHVETALRRIAWVARQKTYFEYIDFEVENDLSHSAARFFLRTLENLELVRRVNNKFERRERTRWFTLFTFMKREQGEEPTTALLRECLQELYYAGASRRPIVDKLENFLKCR